MNKLLLALALVADLALVLNVYHHWDDKGVVLKCEPQRNNTTCVIVYDRIN